MGKKRYRNPAVWLLPRSQLESKVLTTSGWSVPTLVWQGAPFTLVSNQVPTLPTWDKIVRHDLITVGFGKLEKGAQFGVGGKSMGVESLCHTEDAIHELFVDDPRLEVVLIWSAQIDWPLRPVPFWERSSIMFFIGKSAETK